MGKAGRVAASVRKRGHEHAAVTARRLQLGSSDWRPGGFRNTQRFSQPELNGDLPVQKHSVQLIEDIGRSVTWQWWHRDGWKDYDPFSNARIEEAYQLGKATVRVKTGKTGGTPMELFFKDMVQYDPITENERSIQRLGADLWWPWIRRHLFRIVDELTRSENAGYHKDLRDYKQKKLVLRQHTSRLFLMRAPARDALRPNSQLTEFVMSFKFNVFCALVIVLNFIWLGLDAEFNDADQILDSQLWIQVGEYFFCAFFMGELVMRFLAYRNKMACWRDPWFLFDFVLVAVSITELWILPLTALALGDDPKAAADGQNAKGVSVARIGRLFKIFRVGRSGRAFKVFPEVFVQLKAMIHAMKAAAWICSLLALLLFSFALVITHLAKLELGTDDQKHFETLSESSWVLLFQGIFQDGPAEFLLSVDAKVLDYTFVLFICLVGFIVINQLIGVLCSVVATTSREQKENIELEFLRQNLYELMELHDEAGERTLSKGDFSLLMQNPETHVILRQFGVDEKDLWRMTDFLFRHADPAENPLTIRDPGASSAPMSTSFSGTEEQKRARLPFRDFFKLMLRLKGSHRAKVTDIVDLREYLTSLISRQRKVLAWHFRQLRSLLATLDRLAAAQQPTPGPADDRASQNLQLMQPMKCEATRPLPPPGEPMQSQLRQAAIGSAIETEWLEEVALPQQSDGKEQMNLSRLQDQIDALIVGQIQIQERQRRMEAQSQAWRKEMADTTAALGDGVRELSCRLSRMEVSMKTHPRAHALTCANDHSQRRTFAVRANSAVAAAVLDGHAQDVTSKLHTQQSRARAHSYSYC